MITYLVAWLVADVTLSGLVSSRVRPGRLQQKETLPAVTYTAVSRVAPHTRDSVDSLAFTRWQFDCHARTYDQCTAVANALIARAQTFTRSSAPKVTRVFVETVRDFDSEQYDELPYYRRMIELWIIHGE